MDKIPSVKDISIYGSLDEQTAIEHFGNKTVDEAYDILCDDAVAILDDFMWMGPVAFAYYFRAVIRYFSELPATKDNLIDFIFLKGTVSFKLEYYMKEIKPFIDDLLPIFEKCIAYLTAKHSSTFELLEGYEDITDRISKEQILNILSCCDSVDKKLADQIADEALSLLSDGTISLNLKDQEEKELSEFITLCDALRRV